MYSFGTLWGSLTDQFLLGTNQTKSICIRKHKFLGVTNTVCWRGFHIQNHHTNGPLIFDLFLQEVVIEEDLPIVEAKEEEDEVKMEVDEQNNSTPVPFTQSEEAPATPKV